LFSEGKELHFTASMPFVFKLLSAELWGSVRDLRGSANTLPL